MLGGAGRAVGDPDEPGSPGEASPPGEGTPPAGPSALSPESGTQSKTPSVRLYHWVSLKGLLVKYCS